MVEPIFFREDQLGYAVFEAEPTKEAIYEILGGQISASFKRTILTERNIRLYDEALEARKIGRTGQPTEKPLPFNGQP